MLEESKAPRIGVWRRRRVPAVWRRSDSGRRAPIGIVVRLYGLLCAIRSAPDYRPRDEEQRERSPSRGLDSTRSRPSIGGWDRVRSKFAFLLAPGRAYSWRGPVSRASAHGAEAAAGRYSN